MEKRIEGRKGAFFLSPYWPYGIAVILSVCPVMNESKCMCMYRPKHRQY